MLSHGQKRPRKSQDVFDEFSFNGTFNNLVFLPGDAGDPGNSLFTTMDKKAMIPFPTDETAQFVSEFLEEEIDKALQIRLDPVADSSDGCMEAKRSETPFNTSSNTSPDDSPFESFVKQESVTSGGNDDDHDQVKLLGPSKISASGVCEETVATLKKSMASSSRLIGTFTALKTTYLKLCKEFNFLLGKFNENEKIKIDLIHENNELRKLLWETIKDRELDRKEYKAQLARLGK